MVIEIIFCLWCIRDTTNYQQTKSVFSFNEFYFNRILTIQNNFNHVKLDGNWSPQLSNFTSRVVGRKGLQWKEERVTIWKKVNESIGRHSRKTKKTSKWEELSRWHQDVGAWTSRRWKVGHKITRERKKERLSIFMKHDICLKNLYPT